MTQKLTEIDWFAQREEDSYRDEAKNILDSYAHPWDVLAELAQNAVDAIETKRTEGAKEFKAWIDIEIDQNTRTIRFKDNGVGIADEDMKRVLRPHYSGKRGKSLRGEKGVGLTYIALIGNRFEITSKVDGTVQTLTVRGSQDWLLGRGIRPKLFLSPSDKDLAPKESSYTAVTVADIPEVSADSEDVDVFALSFQQLEFLLRTRTAIGWTGGLFDLPPSTPISIHLTVKQAASGTDSKEIRFAYASPEERLLKKSLISLADVKTHLANDEPRKIYGKAIRFNQIFPRKGGKDLRVYCLLMSRHVYNQQTEELQLKEDIRIQGGIYIATKGMPTGIVLQPPKTGGVTALPQSLEVRKLRGFRGF